MKRSSYRLSLISVINPCIPYIEKVRLKHAYLSFVDKNSKYQREVNIFLSTAQSVHFMLRAEHFTSQELPNSLQTN